MREKKKARPRRGFGRKKRMMIIMGTANSGKNFQIILQPIAPERVDICESLAEYLSAQFGANIRIAGLIAPPASAFDGERKQWRSTGVLGWLSKRFEPDADTKILAVCEMDAYSGTLNFVFGEAYFNGRMAAIYLARLRQEFYGLVRDDSLFAERAVKEAVHELGHALGLAHCPKRECVMHFSNSLDDTDTKRKDFCERCRGYLSSIKT